MNRNLYPVPLAEQIAKLCLVKMSLGTEGVCQNFFHDLIAESLVAAGYIFHGTPQHQPSHERTELGKKTSLKRRTHHRASIDVTRAKCTFIAFSHSTYKSMQSPRIMRAASIHFNNKLRFAQHGFPETAQVGINNISIFRGPDKVISGILSLLFFTQFRSGILRGIVHNQIYGCPRIFINDLC